MRARGGGGDQNRQLNCRRRSRLSCRPQPSQELPGKSRGVQSRRLNHRWRSRLATGAQILQPGRPGRGLDKSILPIRLPLGRQKLELLLPTAPVEPPVTAVVPVEQVAQKRKASSLLPPKTVTRPMGDSPKPDQGEV